MQEYKKIGSNKNAKSLYKAKYEDIDEALVIWTHEARKNNITFNHEIFKIKSSKCDKKLGYKDVKVLFQNSLKEMD